MSGCQPYFKHRALVQQVSQNIKVTAQKNTIFPLSIYLKRVTNLFTKLQRVSSFFCAMKNLTFLLSEILKST